MKKIITLLIVIFTVFVIAGCSNSGYKDVSAEKGKELIDTMPNLQLVDVREIEEYEAGHIKDSVLIPLGELPDRLDELKKDAPVLLICRTGNRSGQAGTILAEQGFTEVYNLAPGVTGWPYGLQK